MPEFSKQASEYALFRPQYPDALFDYLASLTTGSEMALDCATGNGQAALGFAQHYRQVIATDISERQIAHAFPHNRISYRVRPAEHSGLRSCSVDLVTVAQAVHWFDYAAFYREVKRVLKPGVYWLSGHTISLKSKPPLTRY